MGSRANARFRSAAPPNVGWRPSELLSNVTFEKFETTEPDRKSNIEDATRPATLVLQYCVRPVEALAPHKLRKSDISSANR